MQSRAFGVARLRLLYWPFAGPLLQFDRLRSGLLSEIVARTTAHAMALLVAPAADTEHSLLELAARHRITAEESLVGVATEVAQNGQLCA